MLKLNVKYSTLCLQMKCNGSRFQRNPAHVCVKCLKVLECNACVWFPSLTSNISTCAVGSCTIDQTWVFKGLFFIIIVIVTTLVPRYNQLSCLLLIYIFLLYLSVFRGKLPGICLIWLQSVTHTIRESTPCCWFWLLSFSLIFFFKLSHECHLFAVKIKCQC